MNAPNRFSSLRHFVDQGKIISSDKFLYSSEASGLYNYMKRDFLYKNGVWRDKEVESLLFHHRRYLGKALVLGHSDVPTTKFDSFVLNKMGFPRVFAVNNKSISEFSESIPLGITNDCDDSPIHRILGNESHFLEADLTEFQTDSFRPSLYLNFTSGNNGVIRNRLLSMVGEISLTYQVTVQSPDFTNIGRVNYLKNLRTEGLVLCPEGNGMDTHRFWETVYMGGTPIVTVNTSMQSFYDNLPVIQLNSWQDLLDISLVEQKWWKLSERSYNFDLLSLDYWVERFSN